MRTDRIAYAILLAAIAVILTVCGYCPSKAATGDTTAVGPSFGFGILSGAGGKAAATRPRDRAIMEGFSGARIEVIPGSKKIRIKGGSGHGIKNSAGSIMPTRTYLRYSSPFQVTDDAGANETRVSVPFANQTTAGLMKTTDRKALSSYVFGVEHGMVCNGSVDDTSAFQTAINTATGATLVLPSRGDCKIGSYASLVNDIAIDLNGSRLSFVGGSGDCLRSSGKSNISIRNGEIYVPDGTRFAGNFSNSNNIDIDNVKTVLTPKGFYFTNCSTATVRNSKIQFAANDKSSYSLGVWTDSASTKILNNDFDYNGSWGDSVLIAAGAFDTQVSGNHMRGGTNTVDDSMGSSGIYSSSNPGERLRIQIVGNDIHDVSGNGIDLAGDAYEVTVTGNQIAKTGEAGIGIFNVAGSYPRWVTISGGHILNSGQNGALVINSHAGIVIDGANNVTVKGVHIADTQTSKTQTYPVDLVNSPTSVRIMAGNTFVGHLTSNSINGTPGANYAQQFNNINSIGTITTEHEGTQYPGFTALLYGDSGQPTNAAQRARGTKASPTAILNGDNMFSFVEYGYDGTAFVQSGLLALQAVGDFSGTNAGSKWLIQATPQNTTTPTTILTIDGNGVEVASGKSFSGTGSVPSLTGNSLKFLRVNAGETAAEWAANSGIIDGGTQVTGPLSMLSISPGGTGYHSAATVSVGGTINIPTGETYNINGTAHTHVYGSDKQVYFNDGGISAAATLHWDKTNSRVGIGTATPSRQVHVSGENNANRGFMTSSHVDTSTANQGGLLIFERSAGSAASPTAILSGDIIGQIQAIGATGAGTYDSGRRVIEINAAENWSGSTGAFNLDFYTRLAGALGAPSKRMSILSTGTQITNELTARTSASKVLTNDTATSVMDIALADEEMICGWIEYCAHSTDGTDMVIHRGRVSFAATSKGGVQTADIAHNHETGTSNVATGGATYTDAVSGAADLANAGGWGIQSGTGKITLKYRGNASVTTTGYPMLKYTINQQGTNTMTPL